MNKRSCYLPLSLFLCLSSFAAFSQQVAPGIAWQKSLGGSGDDQANSIVKTVDGGFIIAGTSKSNDGDVSGHHGSIDSTDAWVVKLSSTGTIQWQKSIGGSGIDQLDAMITTNDGGFVGIGRTSSNDGDVSGNHGGQDVWVIKLDRYGNILWQKCLGGSLQDYGKSIRQTNDNGYILIGSTSSNDGDVTGNPPGTYPVTSMWVVKLDGLGNLAWESCYGVGSGAVGYDIVPLVDGTYILAADGPGGGGIGGNFLGGGNGPISWLAKIGPTGQLLETGFNGQRASAYGLQQINDHQFYLFNRLNYCYPQNPNNGISISLADTTIDQSIPLQSEETFGVCTGTISPGQWGYGAKGPGSMILTSSGSGIMAGYSSDTAAILYDGFPQTLRHLSLFNHGGIRDAFLTSFAPLVWARCYGGSGDDVFQGMASIDDFNYVAAGYSNSNDGDVTGNHGAYDFWVVKLNNFNVIKGSVYLDYNGNGVKDSGEPLVNDILVQSQKGSVLASSSTYNGIFYNSVDTGTYTSSVLTALPYYSPFPLSKTSTFSSYNNTDSFSFALQPVPAQRDYRINMYKLDRARSGYTAAYYLECVNTGTDTLINRTVKLIRDDRLIFVSASPTQTAISGDTISWTISRLSPRDTAFLIAQLKVPVPPAVQAGDTLLSIASIDSTGDLKPADNLTSLREGVFDSYDPNDKLESGGGTIDSAEAAGGKFLQYTIRFQNTGNDTAFNIVLKDTLSNKVDPATVEMLGASAPYQLTISNGNILTWNLSNIRLPESTQNSAGSQGYVAYRVKPVSGLAVGDKINNNASIYFDYNLPVATNTQVTTVSRAAPPAVLPMPPLPAISGLRAGYCVNLAVQKVKVTNIPPASDLATVSVKVNGVAATLGADSTFPVQPGAFQPGSYNVQVIFSNASGADTTIRQFRIDPAVTPVVGIGSNTATVTTLDQPVIITAVNTGGGGSSPLYTFAIDAAFDSVLQAAGSLNTLTLSGSDLRQGANTIYVRMTTSDTCYTALGATASVLITRNIAAGPGVTGPGLTDPDFPGQVISANPNPFFNKLAIAGLQSVKTYTISLLNTTGQEMTTLRVGGQQNYQFSVYSSKGIYLLRVYDETKKRLIGYIKLVALGN